MITTTTGKAIAALKALSEVKGQKMSMEKAKQLFSMRSELKQSLDFYMEQVEEMCERMGLSMENGVVTFGDDTEKRDQFMTAVTEVEETEAEIKSDPIDISGEDLKISQEFLEATEGFIIV